MMEAAPLSCHLWHTPSIPSSGPPPARNRTLSRTSYNVPANHRRKARVSVCQCAAASPPSVEQKIDMATRITRESGSADETTQHPWDPHKPVFSPLLPKAVNPYPSFEGWFMRLVDFTNGASVGVIMATNYATAESQATLLYSLPSETGSGYERDRTYSMYARSKESNFLQLPHNKAAETPTSSHQPNGFEWEAPGLGRIVARPHETIMDVTVDGYRFKAHMFNEVPWDFYDTEKGPEGWARKVSILPTHWYVFSLGSESTYELSNEEKGLRIEGQGVAHQEKNWGETFPSGHVWMQAFSEDNKSQLVLSGAYFKIGDNAKTPYIFAMGYRSPELNIDMRANDPGVFFKDLEIFPSDGRFEVKAIGPSHTLQIKCSAPPKSFSEPILCPIGKVEWKPACRESYCAKVEIEVYEHAVWGVVGDLKLVGRQTFEHGGLEFGEDLLNEAENK